MELDLISIVIPVYNVAAYLERCLTSLVNQTYCNIEIILVDDGSPDECPQMCDQWALKDKRIKVIHKENAGLGMARNTGLEHATGKYICFFDSDDYISTNTIELSYKLAEKQNAEIVCFGRNRVDIRGNVVQVQKPSTDKTIYVEQEVQEVFLPMLLCSNSHGENNNLLMSAWSALYQMKLIKKIDWKFVSEREIISEDIYSLLYYYKHVRRVAVLPEALYYYCENENSLTRIYHEDRYQKIKCFYSSCITVCDDLEYNDLIKRNIAYPFISNTIAAMKQIVLLNDTLRKRLDILRNILIDEQLQNALLKIDKNSATKARKIFYFAVQSKNTFFCYILLRFKV